MVPMVKCCWSLCINRWDMARARRSTEEPRVETGLKWQGQCRMGSGEKRGPSRRGKLCGLSHWSGKWAQQVSGRVKKLACLEWKKTGLGNIGRAPTTYQRSLALPKEKGDPGNVHQGNAGIKMLLKEDWCGRRVLWKRLRGNESFGWKLVVCCMLYVVRQ